MGGWLQYRLANKRGGLGRLTHWQKDCNTVPPVPVIVPPRVSRPTASPPGSGGIGHNELRPGHVAALLVGRVQSAAQPHHRTAHERPHRSRTPLPLPHAAQCPRHFFAVAHRHQSQVHHRRRNLPPPPGAFGREIRGRYHRPALASFASPANAGAKSGAKKRPQIGRKNRKQPGTKNRPQVGGFLGGKTAYKSACYT